MENFNFKPSNEVREVEENKNEQEHLLNSFPWGDVGINAYENLNKENPERVKIMKDVIYTFLDQELNNTHIFESSEMNSSFPWTVIKIKDLTEKLYSKYGSFTANKLEIKNQKELDQQNKIIKKEFVMTSFLKTFHGHPFTFSEEAMHKIMELLPSALRAIKEGRELDNTEIYTLGAPTNEFGKMSPEFEKKMEEAPFESLGKLYADFIEKNINNNHKEEEKYDITFTGISMGCNMAAEAAKVLITKGQLTQSNDDSKNKNIPHLAINLYTPAGLNESLLRMGQISLGFISESIYQISTNPALRKIAFGEPKFLESIKNIYNKKGIVTNMDKEQKDLKEKALRNIVLKLIQGVPIDPSLSTNKIIGLKDPTMFSLERLLQSKKQKREHDNTLGYNILPRTNPNSRNFGIKMSHTIPFFRKNEFVRWNKVSETFLNLDK